MTFLAQMTWSQWFVGMALLGTCGLLILVVLLQRGRGGGLAGAFGGGGGSSAFGAKTGDVFTWITVVVATVFVGLSVAANFVFDDSATARVQGADLGQTPPVDTTPAPGTQSDLPPVPPSPPLGSDLGTRGSQPEDLGTAAKPPALDAKEEAAGEVGGDAGEKEPSDEGDEKLTDDKAQEQPDP